MGIKEILDSLDRDPAVRNGYLLRVGCSNGEKHTGYLASETFQGGGWLVVDRSGGRRIRINPEHIVSLEALSLEDEEGSA